MAWPIGLLVAAALLAGCTTAPGSGGSGAGDTTCEDGPEDPTGGRINDASYGPGPFAGVTIYPACAEQALGTLMYVHGGGYTGGSRTDAGWASVRQLRTLGWAIVSIDYELSPFATWPEHPLDVRRAIDWWRATGASEYALPAYPLVGVGWSAGGQLVEWVQLEDSGPRFDAAVSVGGSTWWPDRPEADSTIALFGLPCCQSNSRMVQASSLNHLDPNDPPLLHVHGTDDQDVPVQQAQLLATAIADGDGDPSRHSVELIEGCGHSPGCLSPSMLGAFLDSQGL